MGAHDPAAAEGFGGAVEVGFAEGEAAEDALGFGLGFPAEGIGHVGGGHFEHGFIADRGAFLGEEAEGDAALEEDFARVRGFGAEDNVEEGGFAGTVRADEAEAVAAHELEGGLVKEDAACVGFADVIELKHGGGGKKGTRTLARKDRIARHQWAEGWIGD